MAYTQVDVVLADYEAGSIYPDRTSGENGGNLQKNIANPLKDGVNGSDQVISYNFADSWWGGVHVQDFKEPVSLGIYPFVKMKILSDTAKSRKVELTLKDINDFEKSIEFTMPATSLSTGGGWSDVTFDFSSIAVNTPISLIKEIRIRVEVWKPAGKYYFDDIRFTGPSLTVSSSDKVTVFNEDFSNNAWNFPANTTIAALRTFEWGGSALTAPAKYYYATDSLRIGACEYAPNWSWAHGFAELYRNSVRPTLSRLNIKDIGISGLQNLSICYAIKWTSAPTSFSEAPTIEYSLDGTSWTAATTSSTLPSATETWAARVTHALSGALGTTMFIRMTNNTTGIFAVDSIKVDGNPAFVTSINVEAQDGVNAIDIDDATKQMVPNVLPSAANQNVYWSVSNGTGKATISSTGVLTPLKNGTVSVIARSLDLYGTVKDTQIVVLTNQRYPVTNIEVTGTGGVNTLTQKNQTLQMLVKYTPSDADTLDVTWSIDPTDADSATISSTGLLTAIKNSTVKVIATAKDASHVTGTMDVIITGQNKQVESVDITSDNTISSNHGTLALTATVLPTDADVQSVTWSIVSSDTDTASISGATLTAIRNGKVTVRATSDGNPTIYAEKEITISNQIVEPTAIIVKGEGNATSISSDKGTLQMSVDVSPTEAANTVTWSISSSDADTASISPTGLLTAKLNGKVTVRATSTIVNTVYGEKEITITNQSINVTSITVAGADITTNGGFSTMTATVAPTNATEQGVTWSVSDATIATIDATGKLTALKNGTVTVTATTKESGSTVAGTKVVAISGQLVKVTGITITAAGNATDITFLKGTLKLTESVLPADATDKTVTWTTSDATKATVAADGTVTAVANGTVIITATANDGSTKTGTISLTISGQTGIGSIIAGKLQIFPNPVIDVLNIENADEVKKVEIINSNGLVVKVVEIHTQSAAINVQSLKAGFYIAKAFTDRGICVSTFIKK
jgi:uncharacterized protein YjdB